MTGPILDDIIDNRKIRMGDVINSYLPTIEHLDISTGYFDMNGYAIVRDQLESRLSDSNFKFRLLMGVNSISDKTPKNFEDLVTQNIDDKQHQLWSDPHDDITPLDVSIADMDLKADSHDAVAGLRQILQKDTVQIRCGKSRFNHAKCYILGRQSALIGSSNFTQPGLGSIDKHKRYNYELNASIRSKAVTDDAQDWFDDMWNMSDDVKQDVIDALERSKFGDPAKPLDVYLQMVFEKFKQRFIDNVKASEDTNAASELAPFQTEAVLNAMDMMRNWNGALVSDSVGLGKTHIGLDIIQRKIAERKRVMLVAPRQVLDTVWIPKIRDALFKVEMVGMEEIGRKEFAEKIHEYRKVDVIVIDESHGFRNANANRHINMMKLVTVKDREVVLMSATPYNNTLLDIYHQVLIMTGGDKHKFTDLEIPDMEAYFKEIVRQGTKSAMDRAQPLLETIMVRRTRDYIKEKHPNAQIGGHKIQFPKRNYGQIHYEMPFHGIYKEVTETIMELHMTPYGLEYYNMTLSEEERDRRWGTAHLQNILLIKRFESSIEAVRTSLDRMRRLYEVMLGIFNRNKVVVRKDLNKIVTQWNQIESSGSEDEGGSTQTDEQMFEYIIQEMGNYEQVNSQDYDMKMILRHMKHDMEKLDVLIDHIDEMRPFDKKFDAVADRILSDGALEKDGKKVLLFTEYTDTAKYVYKRIQEKFPKSRVLLLTGNTGKKTRVEFVQMFAPKANGADEAGVTKRADILVSTEVLSEGQNLQDCNYIINYDLPWNPVRIVQRIGRLDRLTSEWDVLHSLQCFPDANLTEQVDITGKVRSKVKDISNLGLLDADLLGVRANPKQFTDSMSGLKIIMGTDHAAATEVWKTIELEADLFPKFTYLDILKKYASKEFVNRMIHEPMGRRSGILRPGATPCAVLAYRHGKSDFYTVLYKYDEDKAEVIKFNEAFKIIDCSEDTQSHLPMDTDNKSNSFKHMVRIDNLARTAIVERSGQDVISKINKPNIDEKNMKETIKNTMRRGLLSEEDAEFIHNLMKRGKLSPWYKDLEDFVDDMDKQAAQRFVTELRKNFNLQDKNNKFNHTLQINRDDLKLIGTLFVMDKKFDPGIHWSHV